MRVDTAIAAEIAARKLRQIEPVVQDRPQHAIGEAVVIFLIVGLDQVGDDVGHVAALNGPGRDLLFSRNRSTPAEPEAAVALEQRAHRNGKPARLAIAARDGYTVGNDDQPRQYRSSQLRDSRIAVKIKPAIE